ncbi:SURF1 family protein [Streptomyces xiamenensis]
MYRFLLTPRWWGINVFVALSIPFCLVMGFWQLDRFEGRVDTHREREEQAARAETSEPRPLRELLPVTTATLGEQATVTGTYDPEQELLVPRRDLNGERGYYVLTPLLPADGGDALPVVRGWLPGEADPAAVPAAPSGEVTVVGALQGAESPRDVSPPTGLPPGQLGVIGAASLINVLPYPVENAWVTVREAEAPLLAVPPASATNTGLDMKAFQNLGYTAEWFAFIAFALFMWYRFFRRELEAQHDAALGLGAPVPAPAPAQDRAREETSPDPDPDQDPVSPADASARTRSPSASA